MLAAAVHALPYAIPLFSMLKRCCYQHASVDSYATDVDCLPLLLRLFCKKSLVGAAIVWLPSISLCQAWPQPAGNYGAGLMALISAKADGFSDVVYLDARTESNLEELSAANIFVVKVTTQLLQSADFRLSQQSCAILLRKRETRTTFVTIVASAARSSCSTAAMQPCV